MSLPSLPRHWILTHRGCSDKARHLDSGDVVMARAGGYKEQISMSAYDQVALRH